MSPEGRRGVDIKTSYRCCLSTFDNPLCQYTYPLPLLDEWTDLALDDTKMMTMNKIKSVKHRFKRTQVSPQDR